MTAKLPGSEKMPVLFLGHGSPMNAIQDNDFTQAFKEVGNSIPKPAAIICISAHWETHGTYVTAMQKPRTIHDFGGFPRELFEVQYPAAGHPELAAATNRVLQKAEIGLDYSWGLDHGTWSVVKHLYPDADVPVIQLSLDRTKPAQFHYDLAAELSAFRRQGVLIIGSGNMVHNLRLVGRHEIKGARFGYDWAIEADERMKAHILDGDFMSLIDYDKQGRSFELAIPTPEHFLPLIYTLALKESSDTTTLFNDQTVGGSISMTSVRFA